MLHMVMGWIIYIHEPTYNNIIVQSWNQTVSKRQKPKNKEVGGFFIIIKKNYVQEMMIRILYREFCVKTKEEHSGRV
jgi:hypothetical protein